MKKKFLFAFIVIAVNVVVFGAINASAATSGNYTYSIYNGEATITDCNTSISGRITIPSKLGGYPVTSIGDNAFQNCIYLKSITIPNGVTNIGEYAFSFCYMLTNISIPDSVTHIGCGAFSYNGYSDNLANWENNALYIGNHLISASVSGSYKIKDGTITIADYAFNSCTSLTSVSMPDSVRSIGEHAFSYCGKLTTITIPDSVTSIGAAAFCNCSKLTNIIIPDGVTNISKNAFEYCSNLTDVTIPNSVTKIEQYAFGDCSSLTSINLPDGVKSIGMYAFRDCENLKSITFTDSVTSIGEAAFDKCFRLKDIYYNGTESKWSKISIHGYNNTYLKNATKHYFSYVTLIDENGNEMGVTKWELNTSVDTSWLEQKNGYTIRLYTDEECTNEFDVNTPFVKSIVLYLRYVLNQYTIRFIDEDGTLLKEEKVSHGENIISPEISDKAEYYVFERWQNYNDGMTATNNLTFKAVFKYKIYSINVEGLSEPINVAYNSNFFIEPQKKDDYHYFVGYFTEKSGKGTKLTNEHGESLNAYNVVGNLNAYPYFYEGYMNKIELQGLSAAMPGDTIIQNAIFATEKNAFYLTATVKYPRFLNFKTIKGVDFVEASKNSEKIVGEYKYLDITCIYDYDGNFVDINKNYIPFEIEFDIAKNTPIGNVEISLENVVLIGDDYYDIAEVVKCILEIKPKLAESIEIIGASEFDSATQFTAVVSPDYTTDKSVVWSVNDESVATITQDGTVTPIKKGTVIVIATAKDGSEVFATKEVTVVSHAKINELDFGDGVTLSTFNPNIRKYTVYVKEDATTITLTPTYTTGGVLRANGSGIWLSGESKDFELEENGVTTITLNRDNVTDMTNSIYTIEVVKLEGTKTEVSEDKKSFTITPINIENGKTVILALYNGDRFVEMQSSVYTGEAIPFTTTKAYTKAKVFVWDDLKTLSPVCEAEIVK